jgi:hypothetical protein
LSAMKIGPYPHRTSDSTEACVCLIRSSDVSADRRFP